MTMIKLTDYQYNEGEELTFDFTFTTEDDVALDPTTVQLTIRDSEGAIVSYSAADFEHPERGQFRLRYMIGQGGRYFLRCVTTGIPTVVLEGYFDVAWSRFV